MKIVIYGLPRSGKDFLIDKVVRVAQAKVQHLKGSYNLNDLSIKIYNKGFYLLEEIEKGKIREKFISKIIEEEKKFENIIVDGHYAFPNKDVVYESVFLESEKKLYDVFIYLNTSHERIISNLEKSDKKEYQEILRKEEEFIKWQQFEITELKNICKEIEKELIVLDDDTTCCVEFICDLLKNKEKYLPELIVEEIVSDIKDEIKEYKEFVVTDCDRTLSFEDSTYDFWEKASLEKSVLKDIFQGEYYSVYQFYKFSKVIGDLENYEDSIIHAASKVKLNNFAVAELDQRKDVYKIGVTSGLLDVWANVNKDNKVLNYIVGKGRKPLNKGFNTYVTPYVKEKLVKRLKEMGKKVFALGDSIIDIPMLEEADIGIIVAMEKINKSVDNYISNNPNSKLFQFEYNYYKYQGITERRRIWL